MTRMKNAFGQRISSLGSTPISVKSAQGPHHIGLLTVHKSGQERFCLRAFALTILSAWDILPQISSWTKSSLYINVPRILPSHWGLLSRTLETIISLAANQESFQSISSTHSGATECNREWWATQVCVLSCFSCVRHFVTLWTVACQAPLPMGFCRQEYWNALPIPPPGDLPNTGI